MVSLRPERVRGWFAEIGRLGDVSVIDVPWPLNPSVQIGYLAAELAAALDGDHMTIAPATQLRE